MLNNFNILIINQCDLPYLGISGEVGVPCSLLHKLDIVIFRGDKCSKVVKHPSEITGHIATCDLPKFLASPSEYIMAQTIMRKS